MSDWMGGNVRHWSNQTNWFMYTGREWIMQIGVYDYRNRMYDPKLGRFLQPDPLGFAAGDANLFRYCGGDPVNKTDPTGLLASGGGQEGHKPPPYIQKNNGSLVPYAVAGRTSQGGGSWSSNGGGLTNADRMSLAEQGRNGFGAFTGPGIITPTVREDSSGNLTLARIDVSNPSGVAGVGRSMVGNPIAKTPFRGSDGNLVYATAVLWHIYLTNNTGVPILIPNVMIKEAIDYKDAKDFAPKGRALGDHPTNTGGLAEDRWSLPFTSPHGIVTVVQTVFVGDRTAIWSATVRATADEPEDLVTAQRWAPLR